MDAKHARGRSFAYLCIAVGLFVSVYAAVRLARGGAGTLFLVVGVPVLAYGLLMLRALRRLRA